MENSGESSAPFLLWEFRELGVQLITRKHEALQALESLSEAMHKHLTGVPEYLESFALFESQLRIQLEQEVELLKQEIGRFEQLLKEQTRTTLTLPYLPEDRDEAFDLMREIDFTRIRAMEGTRKASIGATKELCKRWSEAKTATDALKSSNSDEEIVQTVRVLLNASAELEQVRSSYRDGILLKLQQEIAPLEARLKELKENAGRS